MDRPDWQFIAKEISRITSKHTIKYQRRIVRLPKYLEDPRNQRNKQEFKFGLLDDTFTVHTDSDWAGYRSIRNSTTRRVVSTNVGDIRHRISTQSLVDL